VVHGLADSIPLAAAEEWVSVLPQARLFAMHGVGHFPPLEDPERLFPALDEFLRGAWPAEAPAAPA
jgi:pimeloyl-ACP methyl ester carboxylesterase